MMPTSIAFVGAGRTTIYTLHALINRNATLLPIKVFEEQATAGRGTPYRPGRNDPAMLSNIAIIDIPPIEQTLVEWLRAQPPATLTMLDVDLQPIGESTSYPRLVLGSYFYDQLQATIPRAEDAVVDAYDC